MKKFFLLLVVAFAMITVMVSCNNDNAIMDEDNTALQVKGTSEYLSKISNHMEGEETRSIEADTDSIVPLLVEESIVYLNNNGIDYSDISDDKNDPRIAVYALAIAEAEKTIEFQNENETRTTVGGCVLQAVGVADLITGLTKKGLTKAAAKAIAKKIAAKAVPYLGWGIFVIDMAQCLSE